MAAQRRPKRWWSSASPGTRVRPVSRTFEGRDRFAPAAAWLASGVDLAAFGRLSGIVELDAAAAAASSGDGVAGEVLRVDRFGNLDDQHRSPDLLERSSTSTDVRVGDRRRPAMVGTYAEAREGELVALFGSSERLEVAVNGGESAAALGRASDEARAVHVSQACMIRLRRLP